MHEIFNDSNLNKDFFESIIKTDFEFIGDFEVNGIELSKYKDQFKISYENIETVMKNNWVFDGSYFKTLKILLFNCVIIIK